MGDITVIGGPGSTLEAASKLARETATWMPNFGSPDMILNWVKSIVDARSTDTAQNDVLAQGAIVTHRDSIVGSKFALNAKPDLALLGKDEGWAVEFQEATEAWWNAFAESEDCWIDASGRRTMTELCRLALSSTAIHGEVVAPAEWQREGDRPLRTAIHLISPTRLSNPNNTMDTRYLRRGIHMDFYGRHIGYHILQGHPGEFYDDRAYRWIEVPAKLSWGRRQMAFICEPLLVEQTRGVGDMAVALPHMRMARKHAQIALQKAVIGATVAAVIESDLPPAELAVAMGALNAGGAISNPDALVDGWESAVGATLEMISTYLGASNNIRADGAQVPALPPGTRMRMLNADNGGGASYAEFEAALSRRAAKAFGTSYEEFTGDYSRTNYSSGKMAKGNTERFNNARKKFVCDRLATYGYSLALEEELARPESRIPLPPSWGGSRDGFYQQYQKTAICRAEWIGTGSGQIDELKETQAAMLRIKAGLSTWERECARLGIDWREMAQQQEREQREFDERGLVFSGDATQTSEDVDGQGTLVEERE